MKYAIINTMDSYDTTAGKVLSTHRSLAAAEAEDWKIHCAVKRWNGDSSYLPTIIAEVDASVVRGQHIHESLIIDTLGY
jgi:hypothetical protein